VSVTQSIYKQLCLHLGVTGADGLLSLVSVVNILNILHQMVVLSEINSPQVTMLHTERLGLHSIYYTCSSMSAASKHCYIIYLLACIELTAGWSFRLCWKWVSILFGEFWLC